MDDSLLYKNEGVYKILFGISLLAFFSAFILSIISSIGLCTQECSDTQYYRFYGMPFAYVGIPFFALLVILQIGSLYFSSFSAPLKFLTAGAVGAEGMFLGIQEFDIGSWCPICVSIAICVGISAIALAFPFMQKFANDIKKGKQEETMKSIKKSFSMFSVAILGFIIAAAGITKPDYAMNQMNSMKQKIEFGNTNSSIEIYFVTDWFCPACKQVEAELELLVPELLKTNKVFFIDLAIHPESVNYTPYDLAFQVHNKNNYLKIRNALSELTQKTKTPDDEKIKKTAFSAGEKFHELSYSDVQAGLKFFDQIQNKFEIRATPELIIYNQKTEQFKKLKGTAEINRENILKAIQELQK